VSLGGWKLPNSAISPEQLAVRSQSRQSQQILLGFSIDQQQIGLHVAFAIATPISTEIMISMPRF